MIRRSLLCVLFALWPALANAAEPLTVFLLDMLRQQVVSSIQSSFARAERERAEAAAVPRPLYDLDDQKLRMLIDEGFVHLSPAQREEVFAGVKRALADPKNAHLRPWMVEQLALKASAVRQAHERLANLSSGEKRAIAVQAREVYEKLPPAERAQMLEVLQAGIVPVPHDLNDLILAEFRSVPATAATAAAAAQPSGLEPQTN